MRHASLIHPDAEPGGFVDWLIPRIAQRSG